jgi:ribonuclease HI/probable phosphoglycerate mutase
MKQLSLFHPTTSATIWTLFIDGASKNNPGHAGAGIYLLNGDASIVNKGFYLGVATNNQAEYAALLLGAWYAHRSMGLDDTLTIFSDSQLLVRQLQGRYAIKNHQLARLYAAAQSLLKQRHWQVNHIMREHNTAADALANEGVKKKLPLPASFLAEYHHLFTFTTP